MHLNKEGKRTTEAPVEQQQLAASLTRRGKSTHPDVLVTPDCKESRELRALQEQRVEEGRRSLQVR